MDPVLQQKDNPGNSPLDGLPSGDNVAKSSTDDKLQILQLQCIIDAKDRELKLLRDRLSEQEDSHVIKSLEDDVARLQQEVQRLSRENDALRAQLLRATADGHATPGDIPSASSDVSTEPVSAACSLSPPAAAIQPPPHSHMGLPKTSAPTVDADVLIQKLRSVVSGLVSDALAAQQAQSQGQSQVSQQPRAPAVTVGGAGNAANAVTAGCGAAIQTTVGPDLATAAAYPGWTAALPCVLMPLSYLPPGLPPASASWNPAAACTGIAVSPLMAPWGQPTATCAPIGPHTDIDTSGGRSRTVLPGGPVTVPSGHVVSGARGSSAATGDALAVHELNVDGSIIYLERALLETQARGSRLYELLVQQYDKLPLDSRGRAFLSYEPFVFQALLSTLRDRWLLGAAAPPRNWPAIVRSLGVHVSYFKMVASHFGLGEEVSQALPDDDSTTSQITPSPQAPQGSASASQLPLQPSPSPGMVDDRDALTRTTTGAAAGGSTVDGGGGGCGDDAEGPAAVGPRAQPGGGSGSDMPPAATVARFRVANMYSLLAQKQAAEAAREGKERQATR